MSLLEITLTCTTVFFAATSIFFFALMRTFIIDLHNERAKAKNNKPAKVETFGLFNIVHPPLNMFSK